ncbi:MAG: hypothetical protein NUV80_04440 [Candidatus Berkelbacteria bacterium]|nr:hypothetical protein [Candidatus Berkelbacteria bacterium]
MSAIIPDITVPDSSALTTVGHVIPDGNNLYVYLQGCASTVAGSVVTYNDSTKATALVVAGAKGLVAIAMSATNTTSKYGWYMISGTYTTVASDTVAGAGNLYIDGTAGRVDDAVVTGDLILGMRSTGADVSNQVPIIMDNPFVTGVLG